MTITNKYAINKGRNSATTKKRRTMKIFPVADSHEDERRKLTAFRPSPDFPHVKEAKVLITKSENVCLGRHSHSHVEGFFLVSGTCVIKTWTAADGAQEQQLSAPVMFMFEPEEEHLLTCSKDMILVGYMPTSFEEENNSPATHI